MASLSLKEAKTVLSLFEGRRDYHAEQQADGTYIKVVGLALDDVKQHLTGTKTIGVYPLKDGKVKFAVLDFDSKSPQARQGVLFCKAWLDQWGIISFIEPSGGKGSHLWIMFKIWVSADKVRIVLSYLLHELEERLGTNYPIEIFPKQAGNVELGNLIKVPFGIHKKTGLRTQFLTNELKPAENCGLDMIKASNEIPEDILDDIIKNIPDGYDVSKPESGAGTRNPLPCYVNMSEITIPEGERDVSLFRRAVHLNKQGYAQDTAEAMLIMWNEHHCSPPLMAKVVKEKVKQAYKGRYGFGCLEDTIRKYCVQSCPLYRKRHLAIDGLKPTAAQENLEVVELIEILTDPPKWELKLALFESQDSKVDLSINQLSTQQLENPRFMDRKVFEIIGIHPFKGIKQPSWVDYMDTMKPRGKLQKEEAPLEASKKARIIDRVYSYLENAHKAETQVDYTIGRPVERAGRFYFKIESIEDMLVRRFNIRADRTELYDLIRNAGGGGGKKDKKSFFRIGDFVGRAWYLPARLPDVSDEEAKQVRLEPDEDTTKGQSKAEGGEEIEF